MITKADAELLKAWFTTHRDDGTLYEIELSEVTTDCETAFQLHQVHAQIDNFMKEQSG